jgi:serine/threonine protein kinase
VPFQHIKHLGHGGFASVDKVICSGAGPLNTFHLELTGREFARKVLKVQPNQRLHEIDAELQIMKALRHKHIVAVILTYEEMRSQPWEKQSFGIIMEPVADCNLKEWFEMFEVEQLQSRHISNHSLMLQSERAFMPSTWMTCLASGLAFIHSHRIRHKDIKPANILVKGQNIYFTDFGISKRFDELAETQTEGNPGKRTAMYCAPEVAAYDPRGRKADVYSLGCVMLELLTVACGRSLEEFTAFRGPLGAQAYYLNNDRVLQWILFIRDNTAGFYHYCVAALNPNPTLRVSSADLLKWMVVDRDCLPGWSGTRGCSCVGREAMGTFWAHSLGNKPPRLSRPQDGASITWANADDHWIGRTCWRQFDRHTLPTLIQTIPPLKEKAFPVAPGPFFQDTDNEVDGCAEVDATTAIEDHVMGGV